MPINQQQPPNNYDNSDVNEKGILIPWAANAQASYMYYECNIEVLLDSGIVVHNRLPQINKLPDTLASIYLGDSKINTEASKGVNLASRDDYEDIMQRMGHSRYWFHLWGKALRVGYKVPIPAIKTIGGVAAIPHDNNPQRAYNIIAPGGNYGGVVLWRAEWSLWYTTLVPPGTQEIPAADPTLLNTGKSEPPEGLQAPFSLPDSDAVKPARPTPTGTINIR